MQAAEIKRDLDRNGFALLRGALPPDRVARYRDALDAIYAGMAQTADGDVSTADFSARAGLTMEQLFENPELQAAARLILGSNEFFNGTFMSVGKQKAIGGLSLHTDGIIQGTDQLTLSLWAPLHACGVDAPGLAVVASPRRKVLEYLRRKFPGRKIPGWHSTTEWGGTGAFDDSAVIAEFGEIHKPEMAPGDVMIFTNWTIHGSHVTPQMTGRRSAAIYRLARKPIMQRDRLARLLDHEFQFPGRRFNPRAWIKSRFRL